MISNILNSFIDKKAALKAIHLYWEQSLKTDWTEVFKYFSVRDLMSINLVDKESKHKKTFIGLNIDKLNRGELNLFTSLFIKNASSREIGFFAKDNLFLLDKELSINNFKILIKAINYKDRSLLFKNRLSKEQVYFLLDEYNLEIPADMNVNHNTFNLYLENNGVINHKIFHSYLSAVAHCRNSYFVTKDTKSLFSNSVKILKEIRKTHIYETLLEYNPLLEKELDKILIENKRLQSVFWKIKADYNRLNDVPYTLIFHDLFNTYEEDNLFKNNKFDFKTKFNNNGLIKELYKKTFDEKFIYPEYYRFLLLLKEGFPKVDEQLFISSLNLSEEIVSNIRRHKREFLALINVLKNYYSFHRIIKIITHETEDMPHDYISSGYIVDTLTMYARLKKEYGEVKLPKKPKSIHALHDLFSVEVLKLSQVEFNLNQSVEVIDGILLDEYKIHIPRTSYDLIQVGQTLNHCVGNGSYASSVASGDINIILLYKKGQMEACVEYKDGEIIQVKGYSNKYVKINKTKLIDMIQNPALYLK
jgi:hypothetical protein